MLAEPLRFLADLKWIKWLVVAATMLAMTWPLKLGALISVGIRPSGALLATFLNLIVAPILAWPLSGLLTEDLGNGLIIAAAVPSTLASAAVWTRRAGGNDTIAILVTILTNLSCFVITPIWVYGLAGIDWPEGSLSGIIGNLLLFVVAPMVLGQIMRMSSKSASWADLNKPALSILAQVGILIMVLIGSIKMGLNFDELDDFQGPGLWEILKTLFLVLALHLTLLSIGFTIGNLTGHSKADQIAIAFSGSQKTLMVGLSTAVALGLNIIPIVAYHALQLIADTIIADRLRQPQEPPTPN